MVCGWWFLERDIDAIAKAGIICFAGFSFVGEIANIFGFFEGKEIPNIFGFSK